MNGRSQTNGVGPSQGQHIPGSTRNRMPTVEDALPFTPLASIVPFNPHIIAAPLALPPPTSKISAFSLQEQQTTSQLLKDLDIGAVNAENASRRVQQALKDVRRLLDGNNLTQYKFKKRQIHNQVAHNSNATGNIPQLSLFAQLMLDNTAVSYRYMTPDSVGDQKKASRADNNSMIQVTQQINSTVNVATPHQPILQRDYQTPEPTPRSAEIPVISIVPKNLPPDERAQYHQPTAQETMKHLKALKNQNGSTTNGHRGLSIDQRRKADTAMQNLHNLLQDIFEAEDQLQPDTSDRVASRASAFFLKAEADDGELPVLQTPIQIQLESAILKASNLNVMSSIPIEMLSRAQKLCENAIAAAENKSLHIDEDWSDQDIEEWAARIATAENGMVAARSMLRIMAAGRHEKELQSEDYLRETINLMKNVAETCLVPIVGQRPSDKAKGDRIKGDKTKIEIPQDSRYTVAYLNRSILQQLLSATRKAVRQLGDLLVKCDADESSITSAEFLFKTLIFAENASSEKEAAIGIQNFEELRRCAMDALAFIFARYEEQRQFIVDEILLSLEKLPPTKQSARQFKLVDAKPIQLVSALLMRLVQTTATRSRNTAANGKADKEDPENSSEESEDEDAPFEEDDEEDELAKAIPQKRRKKSADLFAVAQPLHQAAHTYASYIVRTLIQRGLQTSKASEEPYRKLLDIFTDDFINVLGSADWPAAEMLLFAMFSNMIHLCNNPKASVPTKAVALEMLGTMGTGILELRKVAHRAARALDTTESEISAQLVATLQQLSTDRYDPKATLSFNGPYRVVLEFLKARGLNDPQLQSAYGHHVMSWAHQLYSGKDTSTEPNSGAADESQEVHLQVRNLIVDPLWLDEQPSFSTVSAGEGRLAAMIVTLNMRFCKAFDHIFNVLLNSLSSEQSRLKSRSLKSVIILLEEDPSVLDRSSNILSHIFKCTTDPSPLVRDSALELIAKCLTLRPNLDKTICEKLLARVADASVGVRKRAMKLLKEVYLRNQSSAIRSMIANAILSRMHDSEESVSELARLTLEEIWFLPLQGIDTHNSNVDTKLQYRSQAALLIATVQREENVTVVLESLINEVLKKSKASSANKSVCKTLIGILFDAIIDSSEIPGEPSQASILQTLAIFARTGPTLFTAAQLERLEPYTQNLSTTDDLAVYRSAVTILRHVIPHIDTLRQEFLEKTEKSMQSSVAKLPKPELAEVAACIWTIACLRQNVERPLALVLSALMNIHNHRQQDLNADPQKTNRVVRLMNIAGQFGKACDFSDKLRDFQGRFTSHKVSSVPALMVEIICAFSSPKQPLIAREATLDNVCAICQAWPKQFEREDVTNAFNTVFKEQTPSLEHLVLEGLAGFICSQEAPVDDDTQTDTGAIGTGAQLIGSTYASTDADGASNKLAQQFLPQILRLAQASTDEMALTATRIITSIARQGRSHPKESGPALVALETSPNATIAKLAFLEHLNMNSRFETIIEKEYMRAIKQAFAYQQRVVKSTDGYAGQPPAAKLHYLWEVLKSGKAQVRKKFLGNLCQRLSFDINTLTASGDQPQPLLFAQFCAHNLAFLEYDRTDEALLVLSSLEKVFAGSGTSLAQAIEHDVLRLNLQALSLSQQAANDTNDAIAVVTDATSDVDPQRLHLLTTAAKILITAWETRSFVRKCWNLQRHAGKTKRPAKDQETSKAPYRASNASSLTEEYIKKTHSLLYTGLGPEAQRGICAHFVDLISTDNEVKVDSGDDDDNLDATADCQSVYNGDRSTKSPSAPPNRKRKSMSTENTPQKKRRQSFSKRPSRALSCTDGDDDDDFVAG